MSDTYLDDGLLKFTSLKDDKLKILTTYDNKIWGNMNDYFASTQDEKDRIKANDEKIAKALNTNMSFVLMTPPENTILDLSINVFKLLTAKIDLQNDINFTPIRANAVIAYPQKRKVSYILAPIDSAVLVLTDKERSILLIIHLGAPQVVQRIYDSVIDLALDKIKNINKFDCYITPSICSKHYSISQEKYDLYSSIFGDNLNKYVVKKYNQTYKEDRYYFDFLSLGIDEIKKRINIDEIHNCDKCTYEESKNGNLFSHEYVKELTAMKSENIEKYNGSYNVIINI